MSDDSFVVAGTYQDLDNATGIQAFYARYDSNGSVITPVTAVDPGHATDADVFSLPDGGFLVVWTVDDGGEPALLAQRYDLDGNPAGNQIDTGLNWNPSFTALADGGFLLGGANGSQRFDADFNPVGSRMAAGTTLTGTGGVALDNGKVVFAGLRDVDPGDVTPPIAFDVVTAAYQLTTHDSEPKASGNEDAAIALPAIDVSLVDTDGSEHLVLVLDGYPAGAIFSKGGIDTDPDSPTFGKWTITDPTDIARLATQPLVMTPPSDFNGKFTLDLTAAAVDVAVLSSGGDFDVALLTRHIAIDVTAVNDAPLVTMPTSVSTNEQVAVLIAPSGSIVDVDLDALDSYEGTRLIVSRNLAVGENEYGLAPSTDFDVSGNDINKPGGGAKFATIARDPTGIGITFLAGATAADVDAVLRAITYRNLSDNPPASVTLAVLFDDGNAGAQGTGGNGIWSNNLTVNLTPVNDAPVAFSETLNDSIAGFTYNPANGHWYKVNAAEMSWGAAQAAAASAGGYLASITSAPENAFVADLVNASGKFYAWTGGNDGAVEDEWRWDGGPEGGNLFWTGGVSGSAPVGGYENWQNDSGNPLENVEPNGGLSENAMYIRNTGEWADYAGDGSGLPGHDAIASVIEVSFVEDKPSLIPAAFLLANDSDVDTDASGLSIELVTATENTHGTVELQLDGNILYTPDPSYSGTASFNYLVKDLSGAISATAATVTFTVQDLAAVGFSDGNNISVWSPENRNEALPYIQGVGEGTIHYSLVGGDDAGKFILNPITGATSFATDNVVPDTGYITTVSADLDYSRFGYGSDDLDFVQFDNSANASVYDHNGLFLFLTDVSKFNGFQGGTYIGLENVANGTYWLGHYGTLYSANLGETNFGEAINMISGGAPDYENPTDVGQDNQYNIVVEASNGSMSAQQSIAIDVLNVDEAPQSFNDFVTISAAAFHPAGDVFEGIPNAFFGWTEADFKFLLANDSDPEGASLAIAAIYPDDPVDTFGTGSLYRSNTPIYQLNDGVDLPEPGQSAGSGFYYVATDGDEWSSASFAYVTVVNYDPGQGETLYGAYGGNNDDDIIFGADGVADRINGLGGDDILVGGTSATVDEPTDTFVFEPNFGKDTIIGFDHGYDKIDVSALDVPSDPGEFQTWFDDHVAQNGDTVSVTYDANNTITIRDLRPGFTVTASDFILPQPM